MSTWIACGRPTWRGARRPRRGWAGGRGATAGRGGVTWTDRGEALKGNRRHLHARVQSGRCRAKPSRRAWIPQADGRLRPLGIAALEDKIVQRAVVEVLNAVYEVDFRGLFLRV